MDALIDEGYDEDLLKQVHAPIGLPINSQTPAEIAISIMAEIIQVKNTHQYSTMTSDLYHTKEKGTLCIITSKEGSAPRGVGSMMLVTDEKSLKQLVEDVSNTRQYVTLEMKKVYVLITMN